jgi:sulfide:quinone oxidoreductase
MDIRKINDAVSVAPQLMIDELVAVAGLGFRTVINNRPDGESFDQPPASAVAAAAQAAGLAYHHQPVTSGGLTVDDVLHFRELLATAEGPVLAFCRSGTRCANLWALAQAGNCNPDEVIAAAADAGYDVRGLRQILQSGF